jgi:hypothetical protein
MMMMAEYSAAAMEDSAEEEDSVVEMEKVVEGMGQPKYF